MISCSAGEDRWRCTVSNGRPEVDADTTSKGGEGNGFRPHELLEASLAACLNMTARMVAAESDVDVQDVTTTVALRREQGRTTFRYAIDLEGVSEREAEAIRRAVASCPVHETLTADLTFDDVGTESSVSE